MGGNANNSTLYSTFHLTAFSKVAVGQMELLTGILLMYLLAAFGNMMIAAVVCLESKLHTPMYFFLCNLSVQDIIYVSAILPKLMDIILRDTSISFAGCITQIFVFVFCVCTEFMLLTSMAYDRYVAICMPLRYSLTMSKRICALMAFASWIIGILKSSLYSLLMSKLSFCNSQEINHFFCDVKTLLTLSCSDTANVKTIISVDGVFLGFLPFILILTSYAFIFSTILKTQTTAGRLKIFSNCSSHLTVVLLFFGTAISLYLKPESEHSQEQDKLLSLLYVALVPLLNPLVYSLRNQQVLAAMKKYLKYNYVMFVL
ncbi:olfactory receptor 1G1-like [Rhinophrynus dorsalis]